MSESKERPSCRCPKTHCLNLHCSCFRAGGFCSVNCECQVCWNSEHRRTFAEEHYELAKKKNPKALAFKVPTVEEATQTHAPVQEAKQLLPQRNSGAVPGDGGLSHVKGCRCREIKCSNMSCGCFKSTVGCTYKCKCEGCANSYGIKLKMDDKKLIRQEQANTSGIRQEQTDTSEIAQEQTDSSEITQEQTDTSEITQEQTGAGDITSELTKMEKHARSEDDSSSYPSKCPRIWPSTKDDTSPL